MIVEVAMEPLVTVTLGELREHVRLGEGTDSVRLTVPAKPLTLETVMVEVSGVPSAPVTVVGFSEMVKSCTMQVTVVVWDTVPLVPITVMVKVPALPLPDSVEVPEPPGIEVGLSVAEKPVDGDTEALRKTVLVKPWTGDTVMVEVHVVPALTVMLVGLAVIVKSVTVTVLPVPELPL